MNISDQFEFRESKKEDWKFICDILFESISAFRPETSSEDKIWNRYISQDAYSIVCCSSTEDVIGIGSVFFQNKIRGGLQGHIEDIAVRPSWQGLGIGRQIVNSLLDHAKSEGCYRVVIETEKTNVHFYKQLGFKETGQAMKLNF